MRTGASLACLAAFFVSPHTRTLSIQGNAIVTPSPRNIVRREISCFIILPSLFFRLLRIRILSIHFFCSAFRTLRMLRNCSLVTIISTATLKR